MSRHAPLQAYECRFISRHWPIAFAAVICLAIRPCICGQSPLAPQSLEEILAAAAAPAQLPTPDAAAANKNFDIAGFARVGTFDWNTLAPSGPRYHIDGIGGGYEIRFYPRNGDTFTRLQGLGLRMEGDRKQPDSNTAEVSGLHWDGQWEVGRSFAPPTWMPMLTSHVAVGVRGVLDRRDFENEDSLASRWLGPTVEAGLDYALPPWCFLSWNLQTTPAWITQQLHSDETLTEIGGGGVETSLGWIVQPKEWLSLELKGGYQLWFSPSFDSGREERKAEWLQFMASFLF